MANAILKRLVRKSLTTLQPLKAGDANESYSHYFNRIYDNEMWTSAGGGSGPGSELSAVLPMCVKLARFIDREKIRSIVDLSCGGMAWWPTALALAQTDVRFHGVDISSTAINRNKAALRSFDNISFEVGDATSFAPDACDLLVCRETINHLRRDDAQLIVQRMQNLPSRYFALSHFAHAPENPDDTKRARKTGSAFRYTDWNLSLPPFNLPDPLVEIEDLHGRVFAIYQGATYTS